MGDSPVLCVRRMRRSRGVQRACRADSSLCSIRTPSRQQGREGDDCVSMSSRGFVSMNGSGCFSMSSRGVWGHASPAAGMDTLASSAGEGHSFHQHDAQWTRLRQHQWLGMLQHEQQGSVGACTSSRCWTARNRRWWLYAHDVVLRAMPFTNTLEVVVVWRTSVTRYRYTRLGCMRSSNRTS